MSIEDVLSRPETWTEDLLDVGDDREVAIALVSIAQLLLPYWMARYVNDDRMESLVAAMQTWAAKPTNELQSEVLESLRGVAVELRGYLSPVDEVEWTRVRSDCSADFAGDAIVAAANAVTETGGSDFRDRVEECLHQAAKAVSWAMERRDRDKESVNHWWPAVEQLRLEILSRLRKS
jgi:hypothetical protein